MLYKHTDPDFNPEDFDLIIDARSPQEYEIDHVDGAINLPVLSDEQRREIGILYSEHAFGAAKVGAALVAENIAAHLKNTLSEIEDDTRILVYCWRGNQRSSALAHVLSQVGWNVTLINGGYRGYRKHVIDTIESFFENPDLRLIMIDGYTGTGKTILLKELSKNGSQIIDLEGLANHKGSLFGHPNSGNQPTQKQFESSLFSTLAKLDSTLPIYIEAESSRIGNVFCPPPLWKKMKLAEVIEIDMPIDQRTLIIKQDYQHFFSQQEHVIKLLDLLKQNRGTTLVNEWKKLATENEWDAFISSLLIKHYDLCYQPPGGADTKPRYLSIEGAAMESFTKASLAIQSWYA